MKASAQFDWLARWTKALPARLSHAPSKLTSVRPRAEEAACQAAAFDVADTDAEQGGGEPAVAGMEAAAAAANKITAARLCDASDPEVARRWASTEALEAP